MCSLLLAVLIPQPYQQMITRGAEYGDDRILMGVHYTMARADVTAIFQASYRESVDD
jgi:hypothetical protein